MAAIGWGQADACSPGFPNWLLAEGDQAVLVAPEGNFAAELARMHLGRPRFWARPPATADGHAAQSTQAELADLRRALTAASVPEQEIRRICGEHELQRRRLAGLSEPQPGSKEASSDPSGSPTAPGEASQAAAGGSFDARVVAGLPGEFADYFEGFIPWQNSGLTNKQMARAAWEKLLARPEAERRYKSTWAAFMLGKSWEEADPDKAVDYFRQVRDLAGQGYHDTLGLAAASLGLEARLCLRRARYEAAIELYLGQLASGDPTATNSLITAAAKALRAGPEALRALAKNSRTQKVVTAYVISRPTYSSIYTVRPSQDGGEDGDALEAAETESASARWLKAVEAAGVRDVDSAEALALAAYRANDMDGAARWIKRAPGSPLALWLEAKLFLRAGKLQSAAALLARVSPLFPVVHEGTNAPARTERKDTLTVPSDDDSSPCGSAERQVHGELGVLQLSRGEYIQALDSLLNAGFWMDAAYVAERVLTLDELKDYVDRFWPVATPEQVAEEQERLGGSEVCPAALREEIRYLLGRRLTREQRGEEAREYYPAAWAGAFDLLMASLQSGWDENGQADERAGALFQAAMIVRTNGMELVGTEVAPDWHYHLGDYEAGVTGEERGSNALAVVVRPSEDELRRNAGHGPKPDRRFHYRYGAAALAWEAAGLLPDNDDRTAHVLWRGGSFLKSRDPKFADLFYKALVRRNPGTVLGAEADRQRWFPVIDENGNVVPRKPKAAPPEEAPAAQPAEPPGGDGDSEAKPESEPAASSGQAGAVTGYEYVVQAGDSWATVLRAFSEAGVAASPEELMAANPGVVPQRLLVGEVIVFDPASARAWSVELRNEQQCVH